jgi:hypothetical protein
MSHRPLINASSLKITVAYYARLEINRTLYTVVKLKTTKVHQEFYILFVLFLGSMSENAQNRREIIL